MAQIVIMLPFHGNILQYSDSCAEKVVLQAFSDMRREDAISVWCEDITKAAIRLAGTYDNFTQKFFGYVLCEALEKYTEHHALVHHLLPWADKFSKHLISSSLETFKECTNLTEEIFASSRVELRKIAKQQKFEEWANNEASAIINCGISEFEKENCDNGKNKFSPQLCIRIHRSSIDDSHDSYAQNFVEDIFSKLKIGDSRQQHYHRRQRPLSNSSQSDKSPHCGSCESISSDLMSPQSTAESRGLHHFADKLLYSLSALEKGSSESISSTETTDTKSSIVDCYRRSSAPELRVSSRKSSLKTVFEEMPPLRLPSSSANQKFAGLNQNLLGRRLRSSDDRRCASMESIEDISKQVSYSESLAKNILSSVYMDIL
ncbi:uncharacterized protein LOC120332139 [Styela clava]